jgi:hypothetical protein
MSIILEDIITELFYNRFKVMKDFKDLNLIKAINYSIR